MKPLHLAANLTWECDLRCPMCWIDALGLDRKVPTRPWQDWRDSLSRYGGNLLIDFSGGEPLLFPGLHKLCLSLAAAGAEWALTTNLQQTEIARLFLAVPVPSCISWNVSYHAALTDEHITFARQLRAAGYPVAINAVLHPSEPWPTTEHLAGFALNWIPWQDWTAGDGTDGLPRICNAGQQHLVIAPDGTAYRCQVELQKQIRPMGNFLDGSLDVPPSTHLCLIGCSTCYTQNGQAAPGWRVAMEDAS